MSELVGVLSIATYYGRAPKSVYRYAHAGDLGPLTRTRKGMLLQKDEVEKFFGRPFNPELTKNPPKIGRLRNEDLQAALFSSFALADLITICRINAESNDRRWQGYLISKAIHVDCPPLPDELAADLRAQRLFTRRQVDELLTRGADQRDSDWRIWFGDPVLRAQFPNGPPPFDTGDLDPPTSNNGRNK